MATTDLLPQGIDSQFLNDLGFQSYSWRPIIKPPSFSIYSEWLQRNRFGEMNYLATHQEIKENPDLYFPQFKSALCLTFPYKPHPFKKEEFIHALKIASYANGYDYHHWLKDKLNVVLKKIQSHQPKIQGECFVDSGPVLERDLAARTGLGWIGKNNCLIHPRFGSFFFISEIYLSEDLPKQNLEIANETLHDFCGKCTACIEACPTSAIQSDRTLNADECISYWTIESRKIPPSPLREKFGSHFFGCDICQDVCPWNKRIWKNQDLPLEVSSPTPTLPTLIDQKLVKELHLILSLSGKQIERLTQGTPLKRAGPFGLRRNALIVIGNLKITELREQVEIYTNHERDDLRELAKWTLSKL